MCSAQQRRSADSSRASGRGQPVVSAPVRRCRPRCRSDCVSRRFGASVFLAKPSDPASAGSSWLSLTSLRLIAVPGDSAGLRANPSEARACSSKRSTGCFCSSGSSSSNQRSALAGRTLGNASLSTPATQGRSKPCRPVATTSPQRRRHAGAADLRGCYGRAITTYRRGTDIGTRRRQVRVRRRRGPWGRRVLDHPGDLPGRLVIDWPVPTSCDIGRGWPLE